MWADGNQPHASLKAQDLQGDEDDEDGWEDIDSDEENEQESKRQRRESSGSEKESKKATGDDDEHQQKEAGDDNEVRSDRFAAAMDPDLLHQFLDAIDFAEIDEATAFFLLMTFPFYEHEWDIVGFVLNSVFGSSDEEE